MKKGLVVLFVVVVVFVAYAIWPHNSEVKLTNVHTEDKWCDSIYHRNPSCPLYGQVEVPAEVLKQEEAEHLAWCDSIYHQNVGCPKHGQVKIPAEVFAEQEASFNAWCDKIYHQNVSCQRHGKVEVPAEVLAKQEAEFVAFCDKIGHQNNRDCPGYKKKE